MNIKATLYPKTKRFTFPQITLTEKIDGSNITFFKFDNSLYIATRNNVFELNEALKPDVDVFYKGLKVWLIENGTTLLNQLNDNSVLLAEWLGMGNIDYSGVFEQQIVMYGNALLDVIKDEDIEAVKQNHYKQIADGIYGKYISLNYDVGKYYRAFSNKSLPSFLDTVPVVYIGDVLKKEELDLLYERYSDEQKRWIEGFIINHDGYYISKYIRFKNGKLTDYVEPVSEAK